MAGWELKFFRSLAPLEAGATRNMVDCLKRPHSTAKAAYRMRTAEGLGAATLLTHRTFAFSLSKLTVEVFLDNIDDVALILV